MKLDVTPTLTQTDRTERSTDSTETDGQSSGGLWRRRLAMLGAVIVVAGLVRRIRSKGSDDGRTESDHSAAEADSTSDRQTTKSKKSGGGIARKIGLIVALAVFTAATRAIQRRLFGRSGR